MPGFLTKQLISFLGTDISELQTVENRDTLSGNVFFLPVRAFGDDPKPPLPRAVDAVLCVLFSHLIYLYLLFSHIYLSFLPP